MEEDRYLYADVIRVFAIILVICNHVSNPAFLSESPGNMNWWAANIYNSLCRCSVPLFVMVSGMLLLNRADNFQIKQFLGRRLQRVFIPTMIWVTIYYLGHAYLGKHELSLYSWAKILLEGGSSSHLWFLYMILGLYLAVPILIPFISHGHRKFVEYYLVLWTVFVLIKPEVTTYTGIKIQFDQTLYVKYLGYFILGYYLHNYVDIKRKRVFYGLGFIALFLSFSFSCFGAYYSFTTENSHSFWFYYRYDSVPVFAASIFLFLFFKQQVKGQHIYKYRKIIVTLSNAVFGAYLIHAVILNGVFKIFSINSLHHFSGIQFINIPIQTALTFFFSIAITVMIKRIPIIRYGVP